MTTIAWDGKTLAADRLMNHGNGKLEITKIHRVGASLVGICGYMPEALEMLEWYRAGASLSAFPAQCRAQDRGASLLVVKATGVYLFDHSPVPLRLEDKKVAIGSGGDFARAAMWCGKGACEAVEVATFFDPSTDGDIDTLELLV